MKPGYKQTEVGVIPKDWDAFPAYAIGRFRGGCGFPLGEQGHSSGDYPFFKVSDMNNEGNETFMTSANHWITEEAKRRMGVTAFPADSIVFAKVGAAIFLERKKILRQPSCIDNNMASFILDGSKVCVRYVHYLLLNIRLGDHVATTALPSLNGTQLGSLVLALPPTLAEQEAIASALGDADGLIESLERLIAKKRAIKQGAMQELLTARRRLPGFKGEWETKRLGGLAKIQRGASPRPIESPIWFDANSSVGWVRISDVSPSSIYLNDTSQKLSALGIQHSRPVAKGSLIMSICATVGRPVITAIDTCIHDGFVVFDNPQADIRFLYYLLKLLEDTWTKHGQTGSQMNLNTPLINGTMVDMPPTADEQTAIAAVLSDMDAEITALEEKLAKARAIKQGMMQELLTGRIRLV